MTEKKNPYVGLIDYVNGSELDDSPVQWIVDRKVPRGQHGVFYGPSACMKTYGMLDLALSIATGEPWLEQYAIKADAIGPAVYIAAEGSGGIHGRVNEWLRRRGLTKADLGKFWVVKSSPLMLDADYVSALIELARTKWGRPVLIVIDTYSRALTGGVENNNDTTRDYATQVKHIIDATQSTVISVHHTPKNGKATPRGGGGLWSDAFFVHRMHRRKDGLDGRIICEKMKDGAPEHGDIYWHANPSSDQSTVTLQVDGEESIAGWRPQPQTKPVDAAVTDDIDIVVEDTVAAVDKADADYSEPQVRSKNKIVALVHRDRKKVLQAVDVAVTWQLFSREPKGYKRLAA